MLHRYHFLAALLLPALPALAQQPWQPFRVGTSYQYNESTMPGDTVHVLRLGAGTRVAGSATDSLFRFNGRVGRIAMPTQADCQGRYHVQADNLFGATLRSAPGAVFTLAAANGRSLVLRPHAATGRSWATGLPGLTAQVSERAIQQVLAAARPDSVLTITFSDGNSLRLSKSYGLLTGPSLDSYLNGRYRRRALALTALPERGLGVALTTPAAMRDYLPGDIYQYITRDYATGGGQDVLCQQYWTQDSVLTRQLTNTGDTIVYTLRRRQRQQGYGFPGAPAGFCSTPSTSAIYGPFLLKIRVLAHGPALLTDTFVPYTGSNTYGQLLGSGSRNSARLLGLPEFSSQMQTICTTSSPDSLVLTGDIDNAGFNRDATAVGLTYHFVSGIYSSSTTELTAYRNGNLTWGNFFAPGTLLAARPTAPAATTTAFPNPCAERLTAAFTLARPQPVAAALRDALGRVVYAAPPVLLPAGSRQLVLPTAALPAGLYLLQLTFETDNRSEALRVVKAD